MSRETFYCDRKGCSAAASTARDLPRGWVADPCRMVRLDLGGFILSRAAVYCPACASKPKRRARPGATRKGGGR